ncbi:unnamed protein product, partial [Ectocarpus sp. 8 AP-2014]
PQAEPVRPSTKTTAFTPHCNQRLRRRRERLVQTDYTPGGRALLHTSSNPCFFDISSLPTTNSQTTRPFLALPPHTGADARPHLSPQRRQIRRSLASITLVSKSALQQTSQH